MNGSIFLIDGDNRLTELRRSTYDSEDLFQRLLGEHPAMLGLAAGPDGKLLLIRREQPVPDEANGSGRWSLDHLFLDRQGVPVLVEVKQASDTRARREVVAQMLDYAANGVAYWPIDRIITAFTETAEASGTPADELLADFLGGADVEGFWRQVESNLRSGRIRMLFVADRVPKELARIVEFLNEQMRPAEVLAIEIEQFTSPSGVRTMVPKLVGATERAQTAKAISSPAEQLTEAEWLVQLEQQNGTNARRGAERAAAWFRDNGCAVVVTDSRDSLAPRVMRADGKPCWPFLIRRSTGRIEFAIGNLTTVPHYRSDEARRSLNAAVKALPTTTLRMTDKLNGFPSVALQELLTDPLWPAFAAVALEVLANARRPG